MGVTSVAQWTDTGSHTPHKTWGTAEVSKFVRWDLSNKLRYIRKPSDVRLFVWKVRVIIRH